MKGDRAAGRHTLPLVLGEAWGKGVFYGSGIAAFSLPILFAIVGIYPPWSALATIIVALYVIPQYRAMARRGYRHETKSPTMKSILHIFLVWTVGMIAGFVMGLLII
jgi:1,4-dihydroxy-2-naphthoate octaprenyltransferase